jgi:hypothetical protein
MLRPAEKSLFDFYRKNGFNDEVFADVKEITFKGNEKPKKIDFDEYKDIRKKYNNFSYDDKVMKYYFCAYEYSAYKSDDALILCRKEQNYCIIDEVYGNYEKVSPEIFCGLSCKAVVDGKEVYALAHFFGEKFNINFRVPME